MLFLVSIKYLFFPISVELIFWDNAYNDEDCRSEECIDLIECNDDHIFDINKPPFFDDNDDAIVEEKVVFGYDGRVLEVTLWKSKSQVSVVVSCDEAS
ncbi:hypothetical protein Sjap_005077 [Stephania japonica]|uniref:Uncharacterized protein n=1 Tax=Stephania japonica TaxID=461633 RepID=A0AAP0K4Q0_9MAGN